MRHRPIALILLASAVCLGASSCVNTKYLEGSRLADNVMRFQEDRTEVNLYQKTYYSREGSTGGIGSIAGGGCGCY